MTTPRLSRALYALSERRRWILLLLVAILVVAALARIAFLRTSPPWYPDEGTDIEIATRLMSGEQRYFAIGQSTLLVARPPLFHLVLGLLFSLFGKDIMVLRMLTASYGVLIVLLLYVWGRHMWGDGVALLAAGLYTIYPNAVLYGRFGFLYNQVALLQLVLFYTLWRFISSGRNGWLVVACLSVGFSLVTGMSGLPIVGFVVVLLLFTRPSRLWWATPLMLLVPLLYAVWMASTSPEAFLFDLGFTFGRVGGSPLMRIVLAVWNYARLLHWDIWFLLAAFGVTRLAASQSRLYTNAFFWYALVTTVAGVPNVAGLGYHYVIPLLPWVAVGVAAFLRWSFPRLLIGLEGLYDRLYARLPWSLSESKWQLFVRRQGQILIVSLILFWILLSPIAVAAVQAVIMPAPSLDVEPALAPDVEDLESAAAYINRHILPIDVVLAPPHVAWLVEGQVADFQQSVAYTGGETQNYPDDIDKDRFLFDCSVDNAKYVVLWDTWQEWAGEKMPDVKKAFQIIQDWPVAFERGDVRVYANPMERD